MGEGTLESKEHISMEIKPSTTSPPPVGKLEMLFPAVPQEPHSHREMEFPGNRSNNKWPLGWDMDPM